MFIGVNFIKELSKNQDFIECVHLTERQENDGTREELVLRFFAYLYDLKSFVHSVRDFLNDYMEKADKKFNYSKNEKIFCEVFKTLNMALPKGISKGRKNTPLNLYEAVAVGAALAYLKNGTINTEGVEEWIKDSELIKYTTGATNTKERVIKRIEYCKNKFEG